MADDWDFDELYANTWTEEDRRVHADQPVSEKRLPTAWLLGLVLGPVGGLWFYLGRPAVGVLKILLTAAGIGLFLGGATTFGNVALAFTEIWIIMDMILLLTSTLRDRRGLALAGRARWTGPCAALTILIAVGALVISMITGGMDAVSG